MRIWEALSLAALAAGGLLGWAPPTLHERLFGPLGLLAISLLVVHLAVEGARWQMTPGLLAVVGLALIALGSQNALALPAIGAALGLGGVAAALGLCLAFPVFELPSPPGRFSVGTTSFPLRDPARADPFTGERPRRLMAQVWYPTTAGAAGRRAAYVDDAAALRPLARLLGLPPWMLDHLVLVRTHARRDAPLAGASGRYPVLIFAHGRGGYRQHSTALVEALASHGYVVLALDQPGVAAGVRMPDGERLDFDPRMAERDFAHAVVPTLAADIVFAIDELERLDRADPERRFTGRLDLSRLGAFGVSLGGAVVAQAALGERRIRACAPIDVYMPPAVAEGGLPQPTLWITRDADTMRAEGWAEADVQETQTTIAAAWARSPAEGYVLRIPGAFHANFSDAYLMAPPPAGRWLGLLGPADPQAVHDLTAGAAVAFFDYALSGAPIARLEATAAAGGALLEPNAPGRLLISSPRAGPRRSALP